jgi:hypothetical protein
MTNIPLDKDKLLNSCMCGCTKSYQILFDKIEEYRATEPKMVQYLEWYRDRIWDDFVKGEDYRQMRIARGDDQLAKDTATALRAMADKLEEPGGHFMIGCTLPKLPIFSEEDRMSSHISVTAISGPLGG